jgi:hypothetical protein
VWSGSDTAGESRGVGLGTAMVSSWLAIDRLFLPLRLTLPIGIASLDSSAMAMITLKTASFTRRCGYARFLWLDNSPALRSRRRRLASSPVPLPALSALRPSITTKRIRRPSFGSVPELVKAIEGYIAHHNEDPTRSSRPRRPSRSSPRSAGDEWPSWPCVNRALFECHRNSVSINSLTDAAVSRFHTVWAIWAPRSCSSPGTTRYRRASIASQLSGST